MLRNSTEFIRYEVHASDGEAGRISDLLFRDTTWQVRHLVVDTEGILSDYNVLIDPAQVRNIELPEEHLVLAMTTEQVLQAPQAGTRPPVSKQTNGEALAGGEQITDSHLRSANELTGYHILEVDGMIGSINGLLIDTDTWRIRYLIVDAGEWLSDQLVLLAPHAIVNIDAANRTIKVNVTCETVKNSPEYDAKAQLNREYEAYLHDYYGWPPYWL